MDFTFEDFSVIPQTAGDVIPIGSPEAYNVLQTLICLGGIVSINEARMRLLGKCKHPDTDIGNQLLTQANQDEVYKDFV